MALFFSKTNKLLEMIEEYLEKVTECMEQARKTLFLYIEKGSCEEFDGLVTKTHMAESCSDDLRREIEISLYEKALIPESRGDILGLLETVDKIPNKAESVAFQIQIEAIRIPDEFKSELRKIININFGIFEDIKRAIRAVFKNIKEVRRITNEIDKKESSSDSMERDLIRKLFGSDIDIGEKILLKELIIEIGSISDRAEDTADRLNIMAVKRLI
ncbi:MAG: TIGR00153 family protein [bacterium]|nr:TIGR00153 family protein [bacterium]